MQNENVVHVLVQVLNKLLTPGVEINDEQIGPLVKCVTGIPDNVVDKNRRNGIIQRWFLQALKNWEQTRPQPTALTLALNFAVFLLSQEAVFIELNKQNAVERFIKILKLSLREMGATPNVGYVRLMLCFIKHNTGCKWIIPTNHWLEIFTINASSEQNSQLQKEKFDFIGTLLLKSIEVDMAFFSKIIYLSLTTTIDLVGMIEKSSKIGEQLFLDNCLPSLNAFEAIVEIFLKEHSFKSLEMMLITVEKCEYKKHMLSISYEFCSDQISVELLNVWFLLCFSILLCKTKDKEIIPHSEFTNFVEEYELMRRKMLTQFHKMFPQLSYKWVKYISYVGDIIPNIQLTGGGEVRFDNMYMYFTDMPVSLMWAELYQQYSFETYTDNYRDKLFQKIIRKIPPICFYQFYQLREYMNENNVCPFSYALVGLEYIVKLLPLLTRRQAQLTLMSLINSLEDFNSFSLKICNILKKPIVITYLENLFESIRITICHFNIEWQETRESLLLMEQTIATFPLTNYNSNVIIKGLELISVAFSRHYSLNMVFLTDQYDSDVIANIIRICDEKITDDNYEIRRSAIKVIESVSINVNEDYSALKSLILKNNLYEKICEMSCRDPHPLVRSSAFKCLQEMIKVGEIWKYIQKRNDFYDNLCQTLYEECNYSVRNEVSILIATIYDQHNLAPKVSIKFYDVMSYLINEDSNPVVRKSSLKFWKNVIHRHLSMKGMIDGDFPEVTFSKEAKKIVVLTNQEIKKRLVKFLHELSENGCLSAIARGSKDSDSEVSTIANEIVENLYDLFDKYNVNSIDVGSCKEKLFEIPDFMDTDICCKLKGRNILRPDFFFQYIQDFLNNKKQSFSNSKKLETILNEIISQNTLHS